MADSPGKKSAAAHRERQRRYRERLRETRDPEADDVQRAVFAALRDKTFQARTDHLEGSGQYRASVRAFLLALYEESLDRLCRNGFSRRKAKRRLARALKPPYPGNVDALTE
ncbi:hypothetical protein [Microvirga makkahensis]|uniref:Uncharacterized protein n=1 Tax=Microvirga makkahensis TaxID=1128670 RepID=A0A7X3MNV2_9HYPH|nr:hypothetical protein [Microvirga makkahensis]MXQ10447.1 hypothetical protein [Microvirga makkahensis]